MLHYCNLLLLSLLAFLARIKCLPSQMLDWERSVWKGQAHHLTIITAGKSFIVQARGRYKQQRKRGSTHTNAVTNFVKLFLSVIFMFSGLYYKCFTIVIHNCNNTGQYYKTTITIISDDPNCGITYDCHLRLSLTIEIVL